MCLVKEKPLQADAPPLPEGNLENTAAETDGGEETGDLTESKTVLFFPGHCAARGVTKHILCWFVDFV